MKLVYSERFLDALEDCPPSVRKTFYKQAQLLLQDLRHPSLRAKKYDEAKDIWQARVNRSWRFYFVIDGDAYRLHTIIPHPK